MSAIPNGSKAQLLELPEEILLEVFTNLQLKLPEKQSGVDSNVDLLHLKTLTSIARTCKAFSRIVQPILYHGFDTIWRPVSRRRAELFAETLIRHPHLRKHVRKLRIWALGIGATEDEKWRLLDPDTSVLRRICSDESYTGLLDTLPDGKVAVVETVLLAMCTHLQFLHLDLSDACFMNFNAAYMSGSLPPLRLVEDDNAPQNENTITDVDVLRGPSFPYLQDLVLGFEDNSPSHQIRLAEIGGLLRQPVLRFLTANGISPENIRPLRAGEGTTLQALRLTVIYGMGRRLGSLLASLPHLKSLSIEWMVGDGDALTNEDWVSTNHAIKVDAQQLEELELRVEYCDWVDTYRYDSNASTHLPPARFSVMTALRKLTIPNGALLGNVPAHRLIPTSLESLFVVDGSSSSERASKLDGLLIGLIYDVRFAKLQVISIERSAYAQHRHDTPTDDDFESSLESCSVLLPRNWAAHGWRSDDPSLKTTTYLITMSKRAQALEATLDNILEIECGALSGELWTHIFSYLGTCSNERLPSSIQESSNLPAMIWLCSVSLVNRTFHRLVQAALFQTVQIRDWSRGRLCLLLRTLLERPSAGSLIQHLHLDDRHSQGSRTDYDWVKLRHAEPLFMSRMLSFASRLSLPGTNRAHLMVALRQGHQEADWILLLACCPNIEVVSLHFDRGGKFTLGSVLDIFGKLKYLPQRPGPCQALLGLQNSTSLSSHRDKVSVPSSFPHLRSITVNTSAMIPESRESSFRTHVNFHVVIFTATKLDELLRDSTALQSLSVLWHDLELRENRREDIGLARFDHTLRHRCPTQLESPTLDLEALNILSKRMEPLASPIFPLGDLSSLQALRHLSVSKVFLAARQDYLSWEIHPLLVETLPHGLESLTILHTQKSASKLMREQFVPLVLDLRFLRLGLFRLTKREGRGWLGFEHERTPLTLEKLPQWTRQDWWKSWQLRHWRETQSGREFKIVLGKTSVRNCESDGGWELVRGEVENVDMCVEKFGESPA